jgi:hypothetical protein
MVTLSVAHATLSNGRWKEIDHVLTLGSANNLEFLTWDMNPLSVQFFSFVGNSQMLNSISLVGCLTNDTFPLLVNFFRTNQTIENLNIRGSFEQYQAFFNPDSEMATENLFDFHDLFRIFRQKKVIKKLDVRYNLLDEAACDALAEWAKKSEVLEYIAFDGTRIASLDPLIAFCTLCQSRQAPIFVTLPEHDIYRIGAVDGSGAFLSDVRRLEHHLRSLQKVKTKRKPLPPENIPFLSIDVVSEPMDDIFPEYLMIRTVKPQQIVTRKPTGGKSFPEPITPNNGGNSRLWLSGNSTDLKDSMRESSRSRMRTHGRPRFSPTVSKEVEESWELPIPSPPVIDNSAIREKYDAEYSIERLLEAVRKGR